MNPIFTPEQFKIAKSQEQLPLKCKGCGTIYIRTKHNLQRDPNRTDFCSRSCCNKYMHKEHRVDVICDQCGKNFIKDFARVTKTKHNFCTKSCAAKYNNSHKQTGTRRSKLEVWLESQLTQQHPNLEFKFNETAAIEAELDIYIPSLKLAFELNGIVHYEPIYGVDKLDKVHKNDHRKMLACAEQGIELCVLDTSSMKLFKEKNAQCYLNLIEEILSKRLDIE